MKVFPVLIALWAVNILSVQAQTLTFQISYDEVESVRGELYQYSERYLGTKDALTESGITYVLRSIDITETDSPQCSKQSRAEKRFGTHRFQKRNADSKKGQVIHLPALSEDALLASGTAKKAEIVAKQIYRIREARMAILSGESEHAPADGKALELTLKELNRQEEELTALFVGTTYSTPRVKTIEYTLPDTIAEEVSDTMLRFSQFGGPVASDDLSGEPVELIRYNQLAERPSSNKKAKKGETETYIAGSRIAVFFEGKTLTEYKIEDKKAASTAKKEKKSKK